MKILLPGDSTPDPSAGNTIPSTAHSEEKTSRAGLTGLVRMARTAYDEKRRKDCLALTNAILKIDPSNSDAVLLQRWIQSDIETALQRLQALVKNPDTINDAELREDAHRLLQSVLDIDPSNNSAKTLLIEMDPDARTDTATGPQPPTDRTKTEKRPNELEWRPPVFDPSDFDPVEVVKPKGRWLRYTLIILPILIAISAIAFHYGSTLNQTSRATPADSVSSKINNLEISVDSGVQIFVNDKFAGTGPRLLLESIPGIHHLKYKFNGADLAEEDVSVIAGKTATNSKHVLLGSIGFSIVPSSGVTMQIGSGPAMPVPEMIEVKPGQYRITFSASGYQTETILITVLPGGQRAVTTVLQPVRNTSASPQITKGTLVVNSRLPVSIYRDNAFLGKAPITLELAPGTHALEYRYGILRQTNASVIKSNEVTRTTIAFEATVEIDSTPAAVVAVEGDPPRELGRTPLKSVRVPVGGVLVFRSGDFPARKYTVTEKDTAIHMRFP